MTEPIDHLREGMEATIVRFVTAETLADRQGNPTPAHVLSTPTLVAWFEAAVSALLLPYLPPDTLILGAHVDIHHRRPTPPGVDVWISARLSEIRGNRLSFALTASDPAEPVADGEVVSALVPAETFNGRLRAKRDRLGALGRGAEPWLLP